MDLSPYVDELRHQLRTVARAGGEESQRLAERLLPALESASRMVLLDALSTATGEITSDLAPGSVELRLRGRDVEFVVIPAPLDLPDDVLPVDAPAAAPFVEAGAEGDDGGTARLTLRLPEPLKARIEAAAGRQGLSVNAWMVRNLAALVETDGPSSGTPRRTPLGGDRYTGWARS